jgi:UDP-N-acetylglucosamine 3-dehydrogenase
MLSDVDAVTISTPTIFHKEVAKKVIDSRVHLLVEKPFADNSEDAKYILELAKDKNITLAVGHIERHNEVIKIARECIQNNEWGNIITISAKRFSSFPDRIRDVGVLFDLTIHDVDVISYLVGQKIKSVFALGGKAKNNTYEDHVILSTQFDNGIIGSCETNWLTPMKVREISITTDTCFVIIDYMKQDIKINSSSYHNLDSSNLYKSSIEVKQDHIIADKTEPLKNEINDFLSSIINNREPLVTAEQGLQAVKVVESGLESIKSGDFVNIF